MLTIKVSNTQMPRITKAAKQDTRQRIVDAACELFRANGFNDATTRDLASAAGIAAGTLFNYFPTKEAIVIALVADSLDIARNEFDRRRRDDASLGEDLFLHVSTGLRRLRQHRTYIRPVLETAFSPLGEANALATELRRAHLESVQTILRDHEADLDATPVAAHLYWTLYTGILAFWADDSSPHQQDTLAMVDQSILMFVSWLTGGPDDRV